MGRWAYATRRTVESCNSISTFWLNKNGYFDYLTESGGLKWTVKSGKEVGSVGFMVSTADENSHIRFQYTHTNCDTREKIDLDYEVPLVSTPCNYGGKRWWFVCCCGTRVAKLYLVTKYFACRDCYNLTYRSSRQSHQFDTVYRMLGMTAQEAKELFKHGML